MRSFLFLFLLALFATANMCEAQRCSPREIYVACRSHCPPTCARPRPPPCLGPCIPGCQCRPGLLRHRRGHCVIQRLCRFQK